MYRHICHAFAASLMMTGSAFADACSPKAPKQVRMLIPDCAVTSAVEAAFGLRGYSLVSVVLEHRSAEFNSGIPTNQYEYDVFIADDGVGRQIVDDDKTSNAIKADFEGMLKKNFCQINGVAEAASDGAVFLFDVSFRLNGAEADSARAFGPKYAMISIRSCEAN